MKKTINLLKLFLFFGCLISSVALQAQHLCGFDQEFARQLKNNPAFKSRVDAFEKKWQEVQAKAQSTAGKTIINGVDTTYEIPVVFHIIHTGGAIGTIYNPSDSVIIKLVNYLNQVYSATYTDYPAVGSGGVNIPIRFVLAKRDPNCQPTTGINRINGVTALGGTLGAEYAANGVSRQDTTIGVTNDQLKGIVQWDPQSYYNVWVVDKIDGWDGYTYKAGGGVVAYSAFPGDLPANDGILIMKAFATEGESTLPHEFGHSFSLYHPFQGGCNLGDCNTTGDHICDTDPCSVEFSCDTGINTCTGTPWGSLIHNIMNYSDCPNRFTEGQKLRATTALLTFRASLIQSLGGTAPGPVTSYPLPAALVNCPTPANYEPGNAYNIGPENIADLHSYSGGYTIDNYQAYVDRTIGNCIQEAIPSAHMVQGYTYPVSIVTGINPENVGVWIDFNNNGSFSSNELVFSHISDSTQQYYTHTGNTIAIPATGVVLGVPLRMRVASDYYEDPLPSGCVDSTYGQAEDFSVIVTSTPLPVALLSISATANDNTQSIVVSWKSGVETKLSRYEIEKSLDGKAYAKIGTQNAKGSQTSYSFTDATAISKVNNFYRLKMIDIDGTFAYSPIVNATLNNNNNAGVKIYPNPTKGVIDVQIANTDVYSFSVTNAVGQSVFSANDVSVSTGNSFKINLQSNAYAAGLYYLQLTGSNGKSERIKFIKQ
jgi:hypothetical protein